MRSLSPDLAGSARSLGMVAGLLLAGLVAGCTSSDGGGTSPGGGQDPDPVVLDFPIAYVKRAGVAAGSGATGNSTSISARNVTLKLVCGRSRNSHSAVLPKWSVAVVSRADGSATLSKLYQVPASVAEGQTEGPFTLVTDPLSVPVTGRYSDQDYVIKIASDSEANAGAPRVARHRHHAAAAAAGAD